MGPIFDFYLVLRELIEQIPEGEVTTPLILAKALGDGHASRAVREALNREEMCGTAGKVKEKTRRGMKIFQDFESVLPLKKLTELQKAMSMRVARRDSLEHYELVAGVDASYANDLAYATCVVMDDQNRTLESASAKIKVRFPYIPGYLSFREAPALEAAACKISRFDVLMVNGHGVAHPRGCGLASYIGLNLDVATIGVARRRLVGQVGDALNDTSPLIYRGTVAGGRLTLKGRSPLFVSVGHNITLETSLNIVRKMSTKRRLPEPLWRAHRLAGSLRRRSLSE
jgi:deoxyribonuclease V